MLKSEFSRAFAEYNRDQYIPTKIQNSEENCLITDANDLNDGRFFDPRTKQSFKYIYFQMKILFYYINKFRFDHLRGEASEYEVYETDEQAESWRLAFEKELTDYIKERFIYGACTVIGTSDADTITLTAFVESHKFEPKNMWYVSLFH